MNLKYLLGAPFALPALPLMYLQAKRIRQRVPKLPEASDPTGRTKQGNAPQIRTLLLGESTFAGVGVKTHADGFAGCLAEALANLTGREVPWTVHAKSGYTAKQVRETLLPGVPAGELDLIVVGIGGNDAFTLNRPWRFRAEVIRLIEAIQRRMPETPIVFASMPPIKGFPAFTPLIKFVVGNLVEVLGEELGKVATGIDGVFYAGDGITYAHWMQNYDIGNRVEEFFSDGVHPSLLTYQLWGKETATFIAQEVYSEQS